MCVDASSFFWHDPYPRKEGKQQQLGGRGEERNTMWCLRRRWVALSGDGSEAATEMEMGIIEILTACANNLNFWVIVFVPKTHFSRPSFRRHSHISVRKYSNFKGDCIRTQYPSL